MFYFPPENVTRILLFSCPRSQSSHGNIKPEPLQLIEAAWAWYYQINWNRTRSYLVAEISWEKSNFCLSEPRVWPLEHLLTPSLLHWVPVPLMMTSESPSSFQQFKILSRIDLNVILVEEKKLHSRQELILSPDSFISSVVLKLYESS